MVVNIKCKYYNSTTSIEVANKLVTNSGDICNNFNYYFSFLESILKSAFHLLNI